jgi:hypothetical protein
MLKQSREHLGRGFSLRHPDGSIPVPDTVYPTLTGTRVMVSLPKMSTTFTATV